MDLYACGFNASKQLQFDTSLSDESEPNDITQFTKVLSGSELELPTAGFFHTTIRCDGKIRAAGLPRPAQGLESLHSSVLAGNGEALQIIQSEGSATAKVIRINSTGRDDAVNSMLTLRAFTKAPPKQLVAYEAGFAILYEDGTVATLGDPRYPECLGRDITPGIPADQPGRVTELEELDDPVVKLSAGGYTVAALTKGGCIYAWGRQAPGTSNRCPALPDLQGFPNYIEVGDDKDIRDLGLGDSHAIVLTTDDDVFVVGDNSNGQLGIRGAACQTWTKLEFETPPGPGIVGVAAGPRCSFILTKSRTYL